MRQVTRVFAPLPAKYRRYWPVAVTLMAGLLLTAAMGWELNREAKELDRKRMVLRIEEVTDQLDGRIEKTELMLRQLQDYFMLTGESRKSVFGEWLGRRGLDFNFPWIQGIGIATNRHRSEWQAAFPRPNQPWTKEHRKAFETLARTRPIDCVMALRRLVKANRMFLDDYDLRGLMQETSTFNTAITARHLCVSSRRTVMLDAQSNAITGVLFYAPVYNAEVTDFFGALNWDNPRLSSARWLHFDSMIVVPVDLHALEQAIWDGKTADLGVELFSSTNQTAETWLNISADGPRAADPSFQAYLTERVRWPMYGRRFSIFFYTTPLFEAQSPRRMAWIAASAGAGITLLASTLVGVSLRARTRQERMTAEVIEARDALNAAEKERVKLGHDLHDGAIQSLYAVQLGLTRTAETVEASLPASAQVLKETRERMDEVIAELRQFILAREAGASPKGSAGLNDVLAAMVQRMQPTTETVLQFQGQQDAASRLSVVQVVQLTQIARSALANSLRHARARHVNITLQNHDGLVRLEIADDGVGFDPGHPAEGGMGLSTMRARAAEMSGTLEVHSRPEAGTRIVVALNVLPRKFDA